MRPERPVKGSAARQGRTEMEIMGNDTRRQSAARKSASWDGFATCGGCDNRWTGQTRCHCAACHQTFGGVGLFDAHRRNGACLDPAGIMSTPKDGGEPERVMWLTDGIWQGVETPRDRGESLRKWRERKAS